ncbi:MAG TPA: S8 family serine peptidase [Pyrinomonadaceae bacterium]|jgi:serine protease AprX
MKKTLTAISIFIFALMFQTQSSEAARSVDKLLDKQIAAAPLALTPVVITYDHQPTEADLAGLRTLGITRGVVLDQLPMVLTTVNKLQFDSLKRRTGIVSLYANRTYKLSGEKYRNFIGQTALQEDAETTRRNGGFPVDGGGIGVAYVDTGIDATHPDMQLGRNVVGNVFFPMAETPLNWNPDFMPAIYVEDQPLSDVQGGHGTFGAGVTAGTGQASSGRYAGIAPGAKLVGLVAGNDYGLTEFAILQAFNYTLANQARYNIRVCNNSWGTTLAEAPYDALSPINVATRRMYDRNITVVFAAGNDGDAPDMINPYSVAPWVISVAAGEKELYGTPASFSSRGNDNGTGTDVAGMPADPNALPNLRPDITGSGVNIKSVRSKGPGLTNAAGTAPIIGNDATTIPALLLPYYTTSQGTSFATPQVSGVIALMLQANPSLRPADVITILRETATPMPYEERVVGAGYVDAHNAVRRAMSLAPVAHPANLMPPPGTPEIVDPENDHGAGTRGAQDIRTVDFKYVPGADADNSFLVYTLTLGDAASRLPNDQWTLSSNFGATTIYVAARVGNTGGVTYQYGTIAPDPDTGVSTQTRIGVPESGAIEGNQLIIRLSIAKINEALDPDGDIDVRGMTSTAADAKAQVIVGVLLLAADTASGMDFKVEP